MLEKKIRRVLTVIWEEIKSYLENIADIGHGSFYVSATSDQIYSFKTSCSFFEDQIARRGGNSDGLNIFNYGTEISTLNENLKYGDYGSIETPKLISDYARLGHKF